MSDQILSALIGGAATLVAGLLPFFYAQMKVRNLRITDRLDSLTSLLVNFYSRFSIHNVRILTVKYGQAYVVDDINDLSIGVIAIGLNCARINLTLPDKRPKELDIKTGWVHRFSHNGSQFRITFLRVSEGEAWYHRLMENVRWIDRIFDIDPNRLSRIVIELRKLYS